MAQKKNVKTRVKRSERKNIAVGAAHIKSTFNNTIVSITDPQGNVISWQSAGTVGCRGCCQDRHGARFAQGCCLREGPRFGPRDRRSFAAGSGPRGFQHPGLHAHPAQRLPSAQASSRLVRKDPYHGN